MARLTPADLAALRAAVDKATEDDAKVCWFSIAEAAELLRGYEEAERLREALDFRASVVFENGYHGGDLLRGVAAYMDRKDDEYDAANPEEPTSREVQADLRRWADGIDLALAAIDAQPAERKP